MTENENTKNEDIAKRVRRKIRKAAVALATGAVIGTGLGYHLTSSGSSDAKNDVKKEVPTKTVETPRGFFERLHNDTLPEGRMLRALYDRDWSKFESIAQKMPEEAGNILALTPADEFNMLNEKDAEFMFGAVKFLQKDLLKDYSVPVSMLVESKIRRDIKSAHSPEIVLLWSNGKEEKINIDTDEGVEKFCENQKRQYLGKLFKFCRNISGDKEKQIAAFTIGKYKKEQIGRN